MVQRAKGVKSRHSKSQVIDIDLPFDFEISIVRDVESITQIKKKESKSGMKNLILFEDLQKSRPNKIKQNNFLEIYNTQENKKSLDNMRPIQNFDISNVVYNNKCNDKIKAIIEKLFDNSVVEDKIIIDVIERSTNFKEAFEFYQSK